MIYLDHNATTPIADEVFAAMEPFLRGEYGNPSSVHRAGRVARSAIDHAREQVAALVGAHPAQVVFTSGGTEANNLALSGAAGASQARLVGATEHAAMRDPALALQRRGAEVDFVPVDGEGRIESASLAEQLAAHEPGLVSLMWANNETGVVQDMAALAETVRAAGWRLHTDAVQAAGKLDIDFSVVDLMSLSSHKIYGPKGVGALIMRRDIDLQPALIGGGQERGLRGGTENLAGIVGFGAAAELAGQRREARSAAAQDLRDYLENSLKALNNIRIFSSNAARVANTSQFAVPGFDAEALLMALDRANIAVSSGSACHAGSGEPSHVLLAMGVPAELAGGAIRVSFGEGNTRDEVDALVAALKGIVAAVPASMMASLGGG